VTTKGVVDWWVSVNVVTGSIARSTKRRYLSNSEADFEVFRPARATRCTDYSSSTRVLAAAAALVNMTQIMIARPMSENARYLLLKRYD